MKRFSFFLMAIASVLIAACGGSGVVAAEAAERELWR